MPTEPSPLLKRFWYLLWALALGLSLVLLFATLRDRPFDPLALQHFPLAVLERGRHFSQEVRLAATLRNLLSLGTLLWLCFHEAGARLVARLEALGRGRLWVGIAAVYAGIIAVTGLIELPFDFYLGYWHEHAYNLTRLTAGQWLVDHLLNMGLDTLLMIALFLPLYWLIRRWPRRWWAPAALFNLTVTGALILLSPIIFLPMQGQVKPVKDPKLLAMVQHLADEAGVEVDTVQELEVSGRTSRVNAMVTGLGMTKQVVFYDTLLAQFSPAEVKVVVAHEMSHAIHNDVVTGWLFGAGVETISLFATAWMLRGMVGAGPLRISAPHAARGLALLVTFTTLFGQVTGPVHNLLSRQMEVRADSFALEKTNDPAAFIRTFKKLAAGNPSDVDPPALVEWLSHSHPSIINRIRSAGK